MTDSNKDEALNPIISEYHDLIGIGRKMLDVSDSGQSSILHRDFGRWVDRVALWLRKYFPETHLEAEWSSLGYSPLVISGYALTDIQIFVAFQKIVQDRISWLSRLMLLIQSDQTQVKSDSMHPSGRVFIVHGHNDGVRETIARFIGKLQLTPIILREQPNQGKTIIEKFLDYSDVSFAIVLLTGDDRGGTKNDHFEDQKLRARQNVIFELGFFIGKLGREKVCALYEEGVEIPSDYQGVLFVPIDKSETWKYQLAKEMKAAHLPIDMNLI
jgi:predicted nucleotide-binding protein